MAVHISRKDFPDVFEVILAVLAKADTPLTSVEVYEAVKAKRQTEMAKKAKEYEGDSLGRSDFSWICDQLGFLKQQGKVQTVGVVYANAKLKSKEGYPKSKKMGVWELQPGIGSPYDTKPLTIFLHNPEIAKLSEVAKGRGVSIEVVVGEMVKGIVAAL
jgi:hypothetical protein